MGTQASDRKIEAFISDEVALVLMNDDRQQKIGESLSVLQGFDNWEAGFVCISCGNRGLDMPFSLMSKNNAVLTTDKEGMKVDIDLNDTRLNIKSLINCDETRWKDYNDGTMIFMGSGNIITCNNCGGTVVGAKAAVQHCKDIGCSGCLVCGDLEPYEYVLQGCLECLEATDLLTEDSLCKEFRQACGDANCPALFASNTIYQISVKDFEREIDFIRRADECNGGDDGNV